ncbi:MACPF domain-containing protein NSL1 isoform X2 [Cucurbita moschata]|uniref:MACPF domain-containing protein NSL1 isoform X2 n=1 Tax=Cucurbita moschata TaxID=3662 RepID=A0A6J1GVB1_CUCMO|nr:MACPF domain-containing protein NSL1 isoform X2 [Cucurbita moschata]
MSFNVNRFDPQSAAEKAVSVIGFGFDLCNDLRLSSCKPGPSGSKLIDIDLTRTKDLVLPAGVVVPNVSNSIKCDKGERTRFRSDVVSFNQMSELFNQQLSLSGKIPSAFFNSMFGLKGCWQNDAGSSKSLGFDGCFITLYNIELERSHITLSEQVKREVPSSWDPAALAKFIENYGTHVVVGVKMGGKDVIFMRQLRESNIEQAEVQKKLKQLADERFSEDVNGGFMSNSTAAKIKDEYSMPWQLRHAFAASIKPPIITHSKGDELTTIYVRRGGVDVGQSHNQWLSTVSQSPNVISMSFVPITSLLNGVRGNGFLSHAVNLYLRYKPPIEELQQFLEFQLPRQWAPVYADLPLATRLRKQASPSLKFTLMGPKLYVNTTKVDSNSRPVTGVRLFLEGKKSDHLAIHLQHLSTLPKTIQLSDDLSYGPIDEPEEKGYFQPVKWSIFSHVCTAPVQYNGSLIDDDTASIVTKAWFEVKVIGMRKVLFLRLGFSTVASAKIRRSEWEGPSTSSRKSGLISTFISTRFSTGLQQPEAQPKIELNSAVYPDGPPLTVRAMKMLNVIDTKEMVRGPENSPGYWVVTGAKLCVEGARISIKVKYSLLTILSEDSMI